jgi:hypothetical protein
MALGEALLCIEYAKDTVIIAEDTVKDIASLITDKAEEVFGAGSPTGPGLLAKSVEVAMAVIYHGYPPWRRRGPGPPPRRRRARSPFRSAACRPTPPPHGQLAR